MDVVVDAICTVDVISLSLESNDLKFGLFLLFVLLSIKPFNGTGISVASKMFKIQ